MSKVSIIVPVYNSEKYLQKCLDSLIAQTLKDIEIICVNDCSPDNSLQILQDYAARDDRIKIIDFKENKGVAVARNVGIDAAQGEYIGFVDSDDYVDLDFYEKLYDKAQKINSKLVVANFRMETEDGIEYHDFELDEVWSKINENPLYYNGLFTLGLYGADLIKNNSIRFIENCVYGEDRLLPLKASYYAKKIGIVGDIFYHYVRNGSSVTKSKKNKKILSSFILSLKKIFEFINIVDMSSSDYALISNVFLKSGLIFFLELEDNLKMEFYNDFKKDIFMMLDESKLLDGGLYKELKICFSSNKLDNFSNFVKRYINKAIFDHIRKKKTKSHHSKVSIIVPVYNAGLYLTTCLDSLINQTLKDIEIICVEDCSSDNSLEILQKYAAKDNRIKIIKNPHNMGEGATRNAGIAQAVGEYIGFVDSDDTVDLDFYEKLYNVAQAKKLDIAKGNMVEIDYNGKERKHNLNKLTTSNPLYIANEFSTLIYKNSFLGENNLLFPCNVPVGADLSFINKVILVANEVAYADDAFYHYFRREDSMNSKYLSAEKMQSILNVYEEVIDNINQSPKTLQNKDAYTYISWGIFLNCMNMTFKATNDVKKLCAEKWCLLYNKILFKEQLVNKLSIQFPNVLELIKNNDSEGLYQQLSLYSSWDKFVFASLKSKIAR